jgi:dihydroorotate dehydrogenase (fumarate)
MAIDLSVKYGSLHLKSPVLVASSGLTETLRRVEKAAAFGAGGVVVKTLFEEPIMAKSPTPRFRIISRGFKKDRGLSFYSIEQGAGAQLDGYCREIARMKENTDIAVIASIGCVSDEKWIEFARGVESAGADALELNLSCPHSNLVMCNAPAIDEVIARVTGLVKKQVKIPVISKMTPQLNDPLSVAKIIERAGGDGCCAFSRCLGLDIDVEEAAPVMHGGYAGHGGAWGINYALHWISKISPALRIPVSGCGGISNWEDVVKYLLAGANNVQLCAAIYLNGYEIIASLLKGLREYMERHGYSGIDDFRGLALPKIKGLYDFEREKQIVANIDESKCKACGICARSCIYFAIEPGEPSYRISEACDGCGLCPQLCPSSAISMVPYQAA